MATGPARTAPCTSATRSKDTTVTELSLSLSLSLSSELFHGGAPWLSGPSRSSGSMCSAPRSTGRASARSTARHRIRHTSTPPGSPGAACSGTRRRQVASSSPPLGFWTFSSLAEAAAPSRAHTAETEAESSSGCMLSLLERTEWSWVQVARLERSRRLAAHRLEICRPVLPEQVWVSERGLLPVPRKQASRPPSPGSQFCTREGLPTHPSQTVARDSTQRRQALERQAWWSSACPSETLPAVTP